MQDNSLFNTSIKENLLLARNNATIDEIKDSIKKAKADFVFEFKD
jgi:ABC-type multidrug transport system fused ATPase/permease subunit